MAARRIAVVVTARSSWARIRTACEAIAKHPDLDLQLIVAASALNDRYGSIHPTLPVAYEVECLMAGGNTASMAKTCGLLTVELTTAFRRLRPDVVVTVADRHETLATAIAASYQNIHLVHVQGGEQTGSIDDKVRNAITQLADQHFVATSLAMSKVIDMRAAAWEVHLTGCPSLDLAADAMHAWPTTKAPYGGVGPDLKGPFLVVLYHPETTGGPEKAAYEVRQLLTAVQASGHPALWFWPNADAGTDMVAHELRAFREASEPPNIRFYKNLEATAFLALLPGSVLVGNSSTGIRECSFLGVPAVNVGDRQQGRERAGNVLDVPAETGAILEAIWSQWGKTYERSFLYGDGRSGARIAALLAGEACSQLDTRDKLEEIARG